MYRRPSLMSSTPSRRRIVDPLLNLRSSHRAEFNPVLVDHVVQHLSHQRVLKLRPDRKQLLK